MSKIARRRLTDRQVMVLAALERHGDPMTVPELSQEFQHVTPSEVVRVLDSLTRRGLVEWSGDRTWIYLGDVPVEREAEWVESGHRPVPAEDIVRFWASPRNFGRS